MKKIMFNDKYGLTQAVLDGRKTMTRRVIGSYYNEILDMSRYAKGEVIAIAQSYKDVTEGHTWAVSNADGHSVHKDVLKQSAGWENKMFVKAELMPHHIKITDIKVERLQDISDEDCLREGIYHCEACYEAILLNKGEKYHYGDCNSCSKTPRKAFAALIDKVSGKGTWERNPYCFCYTFKLID